MIDSLFRGEKYTGEELQARLKFFIGIVLGLTLFGIVFVVLYSLIFVTQPMNGMSPIDNKFFELIIPIATFLTGTLSGIMLAGDDKDLRMKAMDDALKRRTSSPPPPTPPAPAPATPLFSTTSGFNGVSATSFKPNIEPALNNNQPTVGFGGKMAPPPAPQPEL